MQKIFQLIVIVIRDFPGGFSRATRPLGARTIPRWTGNSSSMAREYFPDGQRIIPQSSIMRHFIKKINFSLPLSVFAK